MTAQADGEGFSSEKKKLFYTTSDIMNTINKSIASLDSADDAISPRVELQRRMPDGSTRRADDKDLEAADMESKLKQVRNMRMDHLAARLVSKARGAYNICLVSS